MNPDKESNIKKVLNKLYELETSMAEFYNACYEKWPVYDVWNELSAQERSHANVIEKIKDFISGESGYIEINRNFRVAAIDTVKDFVDSNMNRLKKDELSVKKALFISKDIENSILESEFYELIDMDNLEFKRMIESVSEETRNHRKLIEKEIKKAATD